MSHCPRCIDAWPNARGTSTFDCPGCGHEAALAAAQQRAETAEGRVTALIIERDKIEDRLNVGLENTVRALQQRLVEAERREAAWIETAASFSRSSEYYKSLVVTIGEGFGVAAQTADDGSLMGEVLCAKVPELVDTLRGDLGRCREALRNLIEAAKPCRIRVSDDQPHRWITLHERITEGEAALSSQPTPTTPGPAGEAKE